MIVNVKSLGVLIDELCTTSQKLFWAQEQCSSDRMSNIELGELFKKIQTLNVRRNALINAIDEIADKNTFSTSEKTYI